MRAPSGQPARPIRGARRSPHARRACPPPLILQDRSDPRARRGKRLPRIHSTGLQDEGKPPRSVLLNVAVQPSFDDRPLGELEAHDPLRTVCAALRRKPKPSSGRSGNLRCGRFRICRGSLGLLGERAGPGSQGGPAPKLLHEAEDESGQLARTSPREGRRCRRGRREDRGRIRSRRGLGNRKAAPRRWSRQPACGTASEADAEEAAGAGSSPTTGRPRTREGFRRREPPPKRLPKRPLSQMRLPADADLQTSSAPAKQPPPPLAESTLANAPSDTARATPAASPGKPPADRGNGIRRESRRHIVLHGRLGTRWRSRPDGIAAEGVTDRPILPETDPDVLAKADEAGIADEAAAAPRSKVPSGSGHRRSRSLHRAAPPAAAGDAPLIEPGFGIAARGTFGSAAAKRCRHPKHTSASSKARAWQTGQVFIALPLHRHHAHAVPRFEPGRRARREALDHRRRAPVAKPPEGPTCDRPPAPPRPIDERDVDAASHPDRMDVGAREQQQRPFVGTRKQKAPHPLARLVANPSAAGPSRTSPTKALRGV